MSRRKSYSNTATGEADKNIRRIMISDSESSRLRGMLLNIIKNELTARQKEIFMLYYIEEMSEKEIAYRKNVTIQAVSAAIARARKRIYRIMQYYLRGE